MALASGVGLITGLNFTDIISQLIAVNRRPIFTLQSKGKLLINRQAALQTINKSLLNLKDSLSGLEKASDFTRRKISIGNADIASVSASNTAAEGSFSLKVLQLATEHRIAAQGVDTQDSTPIAASAGQFSYQVGDGSLQTIEVTSTTTLIQLRDAINSDSSGGVRASIVNDGSATNPFRLVLTATDSGADNVITIETNDTTLNFATSSIEAATSDSANQFDGTVTSTGTYTGSGTKNLIVEITTAGANGVAQYRVSTDGGLTFGADNEFTTSVTPTDISGGEGVLIDFSGGVADFAVGDRFTIDAFDPTLQTAGDAVVAVDGVQLRRSTNTFSDAIDGVTITAKEVDTAATIVSVTNDNQNAKGLIVNFTQAYNSLLGEIAKVASFDPETKVRGVLFGDGSVRAIRSSLSRIASSAIAGLTSDNSLGAIGIKLESDGKLTVDTAKLDDAISNNFDALKRIFADIGTSTSTGIEFRSLNDATQPGSFGIQIITPAERATITGAQAISGSGISIDENLTFTIGEKNFSVIITAGSTVAQAVSRLNEIFNDEGVLLEASDDGGSLKIQTIDYGLAESFSVISNQDGAVNTQLGIGTTLLSDKGVNVAGLINGLVASGLGRRLSGIDGTTAEGLELFITSQSPLSGTVTVSRGITGRLIRSIDSITDTSDGLIKTKSDSLTSRIDDLDDQIERLKLRLGRQEAALRRQFTGLEVRLSGIQNQGDALLTQLAALTQSFGTRRF